MSPEIHFFINDSTGLARLEQAIRRADRVAIDTEFHAERRIRPELMLIQIATPDSVWLLDPRAIHPAPIGPALSQSTLIVHGGEFDIQLLDDLIGLAPQRIFDTQVAAGLLGHRYPEQLARLCAHFLGRELDKSSSMADWSVRPLPQEQRKYAAEDALVLLQLAAAMEEALEALGRRELAWTASLEQARDWVTPEPEHAYWLLWPVTSHMTQEEWQVLGTLRTWRATLAEKQSRHENAILPNNILIDLARRRPNSNRGLRANRRIHSGFIRHNGAALLQQISTAHSKPSVPTPLTVAERQRMSALTLWAIAFGQQEQVAPKLLLPDTLNAAVARHGAAALTGWRQQWRSSLSCFLQGQHTLSMTPSGATIVRQNTD